MVNQKKWSKYVAHLKHDLGKYIARKINNVKITV